MKKARIIIPYFGKLPSWFQLFLNSCYSEVLDFLLYTDDKSKYEYPENFEVKYLDFENFKDFFRNLEEGYYLDHPYKLCDYRPIYGKLFSKDLVNYDYWGFCDIDIIFGDIDKYIKPYVNEGFDKLFRYGHFSLFKNNIKINNLYLDRSINYNIEFVGRTTIPCHFDEVYFNEILERNGANFIPDPHNAPFHCVNINFRNLAVGDGQPKKPQLIIWDNGKIYIATLENNSVSLKEFFYIHFMRRNLKVEKVTSKFVLTVEGIKPFQDESDLYSLFDEFGLNNLDKDQSIYKRKFLREKIIRKKNVFFREFKNYRFWAFYNFLFHYFLHKKWKY